MQAQLSCLQAVHAATNIDADILHVTLPGRNQAFALLTTKECVKYWNSTGHCANTLLGLIALGCHSGCTDGVEGDEEQQKEV